MNIPGFTAEASLHQTSNPYNMTRDSSNLWSSEGIIPQLPIVLRCFCTPNGRFCCCRDGRGWVCGATIST